MVAGPVFRDVDLGAQSGNFLEPGFEVIHAWTLCAEVHAKIKLAVWTVAKCGCHDSPLLLRAGRKLANAEDDEFGWFDYCHANFGHHLAEVSHRRWIRFLVTLNVEGFLRGIPKQRAGLPDVGKTTLASQAPEPIFLGLESGTYQLSVSRFSKAHTLSEFLGQLKALQSEKHPFKTIVLDTVDALEPLIWKQVCTEGGVNSIEDYGGGYGKGYVRAGEIWPICASGRRRLR